MKCPNCGSEEVWRDEVDVGVGVIYGPYGCADCGWSESAKYDASEQPLDEGLDQWGGFTPKPKEEA